MSVAIEASKRAFAALAEGRAAAVPRGALSVGEASETLLLMGAHLRGAGISGKVAAIFPGNRARAEPTTNALVMLFDEHDGRPVALGDGAVLTAIRTGAVSGAATDLLARPDVRRAAVIGCGVQAEYQLLGIDSVRELDKIAVASRHHARVDAFVERLQPRVRARLVAVERPDDAVAGADVVCTATSSTVPVFNGRRLRPGTHVNGVGSFRLDMREVDTATVARSRVVVDTREGAVTEAGELVEAERAGVTQREAWIEFGDVVRGAVAGRTSDDDITFFKSVGHAVQDVAALNAALIEARRLGLGKQIDL